MKEWKISVCESRGKGMKQGPSVRSHSDTRSKGIVLVLILVLIRALGMI